MEFTREIMEALGAPFPEDEIEFLPRGFWDGKARALAYIDARSVMRRLDAVVGPGNWSFDFDLLSPDGKMVKGKLTVLGVTKCDAGEADTESEILKSAVSDALKRCAVHFGVGRYLYYLPSIWAPFNQQKRQFTETPRLSREAVERALAICGVPSTSSGTLTRGGAPAKPEAPAASDGSAKESAAKEPAKRSIWSAGVSAAPRSRPPLEVSSNGSGTSTKTEAPASGNTKPSAAPDTGTLVCSEADCGKALTKGQHDISVRAFGQPLCPSCQKQRARASA